MLDAASAVVQVEGGHRRLGWCLDQLGNFEVGEGVGEGSERVEEGVGEGSERVEEGVGEGFGLVEEGVGEGVSEGFGLVEEGLVSAEEHRRRPDCHLGHVARRLELERIVGAFRCGGVLNEAVWMEEHHPCAYWCSDQALQIGRVLPTALPSPLLRPQAFNDC